MVPEWSNLGTWITWYLMLAFAYLVPTYNLQLATGPFPQQPGPRTALSLCGSARLPSLGEAHAGDAHGLHHVALRRER